MVMEYIFPDVEILELSLEGAVCTGSDLDMNPEEGNMF